MTHSDTAEAGKPKVTRFGDGVTFDSMIKLFDERIAKELLVSPHAFQWFKLWGNHIAATQEYPEEVQSVGLYSHRAGSIPIILDKKMKKGDWKLVAIDGSIIEEGNSLSQPIP